MKKPTNRKPKRVGALTLKEIRSGSKFVIEATWRDPLALRKADSDGRRRARFDNWRRAEIFAEKKNAELETAACRSVHTFADLADSWQQHQEKRARAKVPELQMPAFKRYIQQLNLARAKFGEMPLHLIRATDITDWLLDLAADYKPTTRGGTRNVLKRVFAHGRLKEWIPVSPFDIDPIRVKGSSGRKRADVPDRSDMEALRQAIYGPRPVNMPRQTWDSVRIAAAIAATCGLRIGEVCGLQWDAINPDTGMITVKDVVTPDGLLRPYLKSGPDSIRQVPTNPELRALLDEYADAYRRRFGGKLVGRLVRSDRVRSDGRIPNRGFVRTTSLSDSFADLMVAAGLPRKDADGKIILNKRRARPDRPRDNVRPLPKFTFHALRAWFCAHALVATKGNYALVQSWSGHALMSTLVDRYAYLLDDPDARAKFEQMPSWLALPMELAPGAIEPVAPVLGGTISALLPAPPDCPIEVPEYAERWLKTFVHELWRSGGDMRRALAPTGKTGTQVRYELRRCKLPTMDDLKEMFSRAGPVEAESALPPAANAPCPIHIPDGAADWLPAYIRALDSGVLHQVACRMIHKNPPVVAAELRRLKLPEPRELRRRLWRKRALELVDRGFQDMDVAERLGLRDRHTIQKLRREVLKPAGGKSLTKHENSQVTPLGRAGSKHNKQGKLL